MIGKSMPHSLPNFALLVPLSHALAQAWDALGDIPLNYDEDGSTLLYGREECLDEDFVFEGMLIAAKGTPKDDVWHWFDERHSKGVFWLMFPEGESKAGIG